MRGVAYWVIYALGALVAAYLLYRSIRSARSYLKFRGKRLVTCPETNQPAAVDIDAARAARVALTSVPHLRLSECSRWPERQSCGQDCLKQIELAPEGCLVRTIVTQWYQGKACVICGKAVAEIDWIAHKPALLSPQRKTVYWDAVPAEKLPVYFSTHAPVCWDCHIAETFRRQHPELVTDRPPRW